MSLLANSNAIETGGYQISRSVRLRSSASAYLSRTPGSATNQKTWTWSGWVKRGKISNSSVYAYFFTANASGGTSATNLLFNLADNSLRFEHYPGSTTINCTTNALFRDPSAWYHVVFAIDTTQATNSNGVKIYVNGVQQTLNFSVYTQNANTYVNATNQHGIGLGYASDQYFDGYLTEINFIDGQALTPSSFGQTDTITGSWVAKKYTGSYGTNGFYLNFSDNSNNTAATIGKDYSGNGNNWTPNNISVTAGTTYDSMLDVPSGNGYADGGNGRGNYAVINPLYAYGTLANGNLDYYTTTNYQGGYATMAVSGKIYFEVTCASPTGGGALVGFVKNASIVPSTTNFFTGTGFYGAIFSNTLNYYLNGSSDGLDHGNVTSSMLQFAVDADTGKCWVGSNNTWFDSGSPATGANPAWTISLSSGDLLFPAFCAGNSTYTLNVNFGQRPFQYTPPTGFKALNTTNLPDPTVKNGAGYFAATLYTGNGSTQSITNTVNGVSMKPDFVWMKSRSAATSHHLADTVRGIGATSYLLLSDSTAAESTSTTNITAVNSNGFTVGTSTAVNNSGATYVAWQWQAGQGSTSSNTSGSITSTVSVNATAGFSIVLWTGNGITSATVGHGLGAVPAMIICKERSGTDYWHVKHKSTASNTNLYLNVTNASTSAASVGDGILADLSSSTTFGFATAGSPGNVVAVNENGVTNVAYCWSEVAGFSKFGSYTGNGSADGTFVYCGFRPRFIMCKRTDLTGEWGMWDTGRNTYNASTSRLSANSSAAELNQAATTIDILSNGFKPRTADSDINASGSTYIYAAFAENPTKYANAR